MNRFTFNPRVYLTKRLCWPLIFLFIGGCVSEEIRVIRHRQAAKEMPRTMPYDVKGVTYYPLKSSQGFTQVGTASWYGPKFHGKLTSNKEVYNMHASTAAHRTLPFNTLVRVTNLDNGLKITVRINDRGPFVNNRIIDLSRKGAETLGMLEEGTAPVKLVALNNVRADPVPVSTVKKSGPTNYSIQVALFKDPQNARQMGKKIPRSWVEAYFHNSKKFYRVLVGRHSDYQEAVIHRNQVRHRGHPQAFIMMNN